MKVRESVHSVEVSCLNLCFKEPGSSLWLVINLSGTQICKTVHCWEKNVVFWVHPLIIKNIKTFDEATSGWVPAAAATSENRSLTWRLLWWCGASGLIGRYIGKWRMCRRVCADLDACACESFLQCGRWNFHGFPSLRHVHTWIINSLIFWLLFTQFSGLFWEKGGRVRGRESGVDIKKVCQSSLSALPPCCVSLFGASVMQCHHNGITCERKWVQNNTAQWRFCCCGRHWHCNRNPPPPSRVVGCLAGGIVTRIDDGWLWIRLPHLPPPQSKQRRRRAGQTFCPSRAQERNKGWGRGDDDRRITGRQIIKEQPERSWDECIPRLCGCVCVFFSCAQRVCFSLHAEWGVDSKSAIKAIKRWMWCATDKHHTHAQNDACKKKWASLLLWPRI